MKATKEQQMETIEIKNIRGEVIFSHTAENNTFKTTVEEAVKREVSLHMADLMYADLSGAYLRGANLRGAYLSEANLRGANLREANLREANLWRANLVGADLMRANLSEANLDEARLTGVNLRHADLRHADLEEATLVGADLREADLEGAELAGTNLINAFLIGAKNVPYIPLACPSDGAFVAWKKVDGYLIKLEVPADAKRCSATTHKCRCDKAKVLEITHIETGNAVSEVVNPRYIPHCTYRVGEMVYPDRFDEDRWNECSHGIHFFINKQDAMDY